VIAQVAEAGISIITNPAANLVLQGRADSQPIRRGITRVKELLAAGVNVTCGSDNLGDVFYPYGQADMLEAAFLTSLTAHMTGQEEIKTVMDMPRSRAADCLGLKQYGIAEGNPANLILIPADTIQEALALRPPRLAVIRNGLVICETRNETRWHIRAAG
jgi:cytosine deaminase